MRRLDLSESVRVGGHESSSLACESCARVRLVRAYYLLRFFSAETENYDAHKVYDPRNSSRIKNHNFLDKRNTNIMFDTKPQ